MKLAKLLPEIKMPAIPPVFKKLFVVTPRNATSWADATDEVREVAKMIREVYEDVDGIKVEAMNYRSFKTPSEWNTKSHAFIVYVWNKMSKNAKEVILSDLKKQFPLYFQ